MSFIFYDIYSDTVEAAHQDGRLKRLLQFKGMAQALTLCHQRVSRRMLQVQTKQTLLKGGFGSSCKAVERLSRTCIFTDFQRQYTAYALMSRLSRTGA